MQEWTTKGWFPHVARMSQYTRRVKNMAHKRNISNGVLITVPLVLAMDTNNLTLMVMNNLILGNWRDLREYTIPLGFV